MAILWATVYEGASLTPSGLPIQVTQVGISATAASTGVIIGSNRKRRVVRLFADADCHFTFGASPSATVSDSPLGAENPEYIEVEAGQSISVIARS